MCLPLLVLLLPCAASAGVFHAGDADADPILLNGFWIGSGTWCLGVPGISLRLKRTEDLPRNGIT